MKKLLFVILICTLVKYSNSQNFTKVTSVGPDQETGHTFSASWGDYNNDGYPDLFIGKGYNTQVNNALYKNNQDGTFTKASVDLISGDGGSSYGGTWGDYDNDGDLDLIVPNGFAQANFFYVNNGDGTFHRDLESIVSTDEEYTANCSWADFNNDGNLDLYVTNALLSSPYKAINSFYWNNEGVFTKVEGGAIATDNYCSHGLFWIDSDNDGDQDLFIVSQNGDPHNYYLNNGDGSFTSVQSDEIVTNISYGGGISFGDIDNDGDMDAFIANGNANNYLYKNDGNGSFQLITSGDIVNDNNATYCSGFADYDNDGDLDLAIGNVSGNASLRSLMVYENDGSGNFSLITSGAVAQEYGNGGAVAWADYDRDGDQDLFMAVFGNNSLLFRNDEDGNNWVNLKLVGTTSNKSAIGARVKLKATINGAEVWQTRQISGQTGYESQNNLNVHFGLGDATIIDSLVVYWPGGDMEVFDNIESNQFVSIVENEGTNGIKKKENENVRIYPNPTKGILNIDFGVYVNGSLSIYDCLGRKLFSNNLFSVNKFELNFTVQKGFYHLVFIDQNDKYIRKTFIVE
jgi:hypothetical protein